MRDNRLQLVEPENNAGSATDVPLEPSSVPAMPDPVIRRLRLARADGGSSPDDAA